MGEANRCLLCDQAALVQIAGGNLLAHDVECDRCGHYRITDFGELTIRPGAELHAMRWVLSAQTRAATKRGQMLELNESSIPRLLSDAPVPQSPAEVADRVLLEIATAVSSTGSFATTLTVHPDIHLDVFLPGRDDLDMVLAALAERGLIDHEGSFGSSGDVSLTMDGWSRVDELRRTIPEGFRAFVAMSFNPQLRDVWTDGIKPALEETGYEPIRVDELQHNEKIDDRIVAELRLASLVVADFTEHKGGVYFECGFAMGRGIPVIWSCREDEIGRAHFDTRQYNHITWKTPAELRERLRDRVRATLPLRAPLRTAATISAAR